MTIPKRWLERETLDFVPDVGARLPLEVIADLLAVPRGHHDWLPCWPCRGATTTGCSS